MACQTCSLLPPNNRTNGIRTYGLTPGGEPDVQTRHLVHQSGLRRPVGRGGHARHQPGCARRRRLPDGTEPPTGPWRPLVFPSRPRHRPQVLVSGGGDRAGARRRNRCSRSRPSRSPNRNRHSGPSSPRWASPDRPRRTPTPATRASCSPTRADDARSDDGAPGRQSRIVRRPVAEASLAPKPRRPAPARPPAPHADDQAAPAQAGRARRAVPGIPEVAAAPVRPAASAGIAFPESTYRPCLTTIWS